MLDDLLQLCARHTTEVHAGHRRGHQCAVRPLGACVPQPGEDRAGQQFLDQMDRTDHPLRGLQLGQSVLPKEPPGLTGQLHLSLAGAHKDMTCAPQIIEQVQGWAGAQAQQRSEGRDLRDPHPDGFQYHPLNLGEIAFTQAHPRREGDCRDHDGLGVQPPHAPSSPSRTERADTTAPCASTSAVISRQNLMSWRSG